MVNIEVTPAEMAEAEKSKSLTWSLKPLFVWMRIIGIDLIRSDQTGTNVPQSTFLFYYGIFLFVSNATIGILAIIYSDYLNGISASFTIIVYTHIDYFNWFIRFFGTNISLVILNWKKSSTILKLIKQIGCDIQLELNVLAWFRNISIAAIIYIIAMVNHLFHLNLNLNSQDYF